MRIEYVLLPKKSNGAKLESKTIKHILQDCFNEVTNNAFTAKPSKVGYKINYSIAYSNYQNIESSEKVYNIVFEFEHSRKDRTAEILDFTHHTFIECHKLSEYHLILASDEVSEYFCNKSYPSFQRFERLIRQLIFKIMTKAFGTLWVDKAVINEDIRNKLKKMISIHYPEIKDKKIRDEKIIEEALYHMDISELESFLFEERRDAELSTLIDFKLSKDVIINMSKEDIVAVIDEGRLKSLWDRFFSSCIPIDNPKEKISILRRERNKVAHSKPFYLDNYIESKSILAEVLPSIQKAIESVEMIKYEPYTISDLLSGFATSLIKTIISGAYTGKALSSTFSKFADIGLTTSKIIKSSISKQLMYPSMDLYKAIGAQSVINQQISELQKTIAAQIVAPPDLEWRKTMESQIKAIQLQKSLPTQPDIEEFDKLNPRFPMINAMINEDNLNEESEIDAENSQDMKDDDHDNQNETI